MTGPQWTGRQVAVAALLTAGGYWLGAWLGLALTFGPTPVATLWPPNAILLAALLVAPVSVWWVLLASVLPVHLVVELSGGVPPAMVLSWYVSNCFEALLGASLVRFLLPGRVRLDTVRAFGVFVVCATFLATFVSSFLDAALVALNGWGHSPYWTVWRIRFLSNVLATQTIVPIVLATDRSLLRSFRTLSASRRTEALCLVVALLLISMVVFWAPPSRWDIGPAMLFAPTPLLLWAAVRFGSLGITLCIGAVTFLAIFGALHGGGPFTLLTPARNALSLQLFFFLTGVPLTLLATVTEERRRAELKAAESERLLSLTIKAAHIGIWTADLESGHFHADDVLIGMIGHPATESRAYAGLIEEGHPGQSWASGEFQAFGANGETMLPERVLQVEHPPGVVRWILARGMMVCREDGKPCRAMGIAMDISERKRIERALRENDERMTLAATAADIGFWSFELATGEAWLSDHCYAILGLAPGADAIATLERLVPQSSVKETVARVEQIFSRRDTLVNETRIQRGDGRERWIASSARLERSIAGRPVRIIGVSRDVTDQREAEREATERRLALSHLARVATVGELTATIVHEVGQPLGAILLNAQVAQRLAAAPEIDVAELRAVLSDVLRDAHRAGGVIGQLRDLLRRDEIAREQLDLRVVVQDALDLARGELMKQRIEIVLRLPDDTPTVLANRAQLLQVLLNLILNARDAINSASPARRQLVVTVTKGVDSAVSVWVADSGGGIAREHLGHVFEPFFTSKTHGLGLGLAVSRSIMREHGGDLRAENVEGGAVLQLILPESRIRPPRTAGERLGLGSQPQPQPRPQPPAR